MMSKKRNQAIGISMQEKVAIEIEDLLKDAFPHKYRVISKGTRGPDLMVIENETGICVFEGEVKTAKEFIYHNYFNKKKRIQKTHLRRGMFIVLPDQLIHDFFVFSVRFVDIDRNKLQCKSNGDCEVFYSFGIDVFDYLIIQTLNCENYKLNIDKLPFVNIKEQFIEFFKELIRQKEREDKLTEKVNFCEKEYTLLELIKHIHKYRINPYSYEFYEALNVLVSSLENSNNKCAYLRIKSLYRRYKRVWSEFHELPDNFCERLIKIYYHLKRRIE